MNPENKGEHIGLRHSYLWRKPLFVQKNNSNLPGCHDQLNPILKERSNVKIRSSSINQNISSFNNKSFHSGNNSKLMEVSEYLRPQKKFTPNKNQMLKSISFDVGSLQGNDDLLQGIKKLKNLDLLSKKDINHVKFPGIMKGAHIHNDYHIRQAKEGFSRNVMGKFFTK